MTLTQYFTSVLALAAGLASLGFAAWRLRRALLPSYSGAVGRLAEVVVALSVLIVVLEVVGTVGWYRRPVVILAVPAVALLTAAVAPWLGRRYGRPLPRPSDLAAPPGPSRLWIGLGLLVAFVVAAQWVAHSNPGLEQGVADLDSLRYHGPFAARWVQQHGITGLQHTSAQNQETYFPGNIELLDGYGILLFGRDLLTPLRNIPWLAVAFLAAWCGGRHFGSGPAALAGVAAVCSTPLLASIEPGSAKNDIAALALTLAAAALMLHALPAMPKPAPSLDPSVRTDARSVRLPGYAVAGGAAGLAVGTKLTTVGPLLVLCGGACLIAGPARRWRAAGCLAVPALLTGAFWYIRNAVHTGTPLPWFRIPLGFVTLAGPSMPYNDRFGRSVAHYAGSPSFWSTTGLPGLQKSFGVLWPVLVLGAVAVAVLAATGRAGTRSAAGRLVGVTALAGMIVYLFTPWSAGGPEGVPHLFDLDLRFLAPALGLAAIVAAQPRVGRVALVASAVVVAANQVQPNGRWPAGVTGTLAATLALCAAGGVAWLALSNLERVAPRRLATVSALGAVVVGLGVVGWPVQRDYLEDRYASDRVGDAVGLPMFRHLSDKRIAVGGFANDYQFFGETLSNRVEYVGVEEANGTFRPAATCQEWLSGLEKGHYDYVVVSVSPAARHPTEPREEDWTERDRAARPILERGFTTVFRLVGRPDPASCSLPVVEE